MGLKQKVLKCLPPLTIILEERFVDNSYEDYCLWNVSILLPSSGSEFLLS
jgi:hypothetical protein